MATPNIVTVVTLNFTGAGGLLTTSEASILSNAAASGLVLKVVSLYVCNISSATATTVTVNWNNAAAIGGTDYSIAFKTPLAVGSSIVIIDENSPVYLNENTSIGALAANTSTVDYVINYQYISN